MGVFDFVHAIAMRFRPFVCIQAYWGLTLGFEFALVVFTENLVVPKIKFLVRMRFITPVNAIRM